MKKNINNEDFYTNDDIEKYYIRQGYLILKCFMNKNLKYYSMSFETKFLYGVLVDRENLYILKKFVDDNGAIYFILDDEEIKAIKDITNWSTQKINRCLKELREFELLITMSRGQGKPDLNYLLYPSLK